MKMNFQIFQTKGGDLHYVIKEKKT